MITFLLMAVGGLNWGLVGLGALINGDAGWNVVHMVLMVLGSSMQLEAIVYLLVGLATVWELIGHPKMCKMCKGNGATM